MGGNDRRHTLAHGAAFGLGTVPKVPEILDVPDLARTGERPAEMHSLPRFDGKVIACKYLDSRARDTVTITVSSPWNSPASPKPDILIWAIYGESRSSAYTCVNVAVTLFDSSSVGAVRLLETGLEPSPKSHVKVNSSMSGGG